MFEKAKTHTDQGNIGEAKAIYELTKMGFLVSKPLITNIKYDLIIDDGEKLYRVSVKTTKVYQGGGKYQARLVTSGGSSKKRTRYLFDRTKCDFLFVCAVNEGCWFIPSGKIISNNSITIGSDLFKDFYISGPPLILNKHEIDVDEKVVRRRSKKRDSRRRKSQEQAKPFVDIILQMEISNLTELKSSVKKIVNCAYPLKWTRKHLPELYEKFKDEKIELKQVYNHRTHDFTKEELSNLLWKIPTTQIGLKFGISDKAIEKWVKKWELSKPPRGYWAKQYSKNL